MTASDIAIGVDGLSKRYFVGHRAAERERYTALRDVIGREARGMARRAIDFVRGRPFVEGDEIEAFWALKDVSFEVKHGEIVGIIGRNGAGKSTLLKILSRVTEPTEGRAVLRGRIASLLEIGTGFHPELTGRENIFLNGALLGMTQGEISKKFDEIVAFAEVERFLDTPVKRYSSGMYVRLAFAVAAHLDPDILIVDEVLAVGDAAFQKKCLGKMRDVASQQGRTVLFVSHNMAAVEGLCGRALLLEHGRARMQGGTHRVVQEYLRDSNRMGAIPLHERKDRQGNGDVRFVGITLEDSGGLGAAAFQSGAEATINFLLENDSAKDIRNLQLSIGVDDELGRRVTLLDTSLIGSDIALVAPGRDNVRLVIPKLNLVPGRYRMTVYAAANGVVLDWIKNAAVIDIEGGDYYGTGRLPSPDQGLFLTDYYFVREERRPARAAGSRRESGPH